MISKGFLMRVSNCQQFASKNIVLINNSVESSKKFQKKSTILDFVVIFRVEYSQYSIIDNVKLFENNSTSWFFLHIFRIMFFVAYNIFNIKTVSYGSIKNVLLMNNYVVNNCKGTSL